MKNNRTFSYFVSEFFSKYLPGERNLSANTIHSYRDAFVELLRFFETHLSIAPNKIKFEDIGVNELTAFFDSIEHDRHCSISTRNQRMAAIKSFFRYVQVEEPSQMSLCQKVLAMPAKRKEQATVEYLTGEELQRLLEQPDTNSRKGRRDLALLSLLYDSAARVQELCDLTVHDIRMASPPVVQLYGKGRKKRVVPLSKDCAMLVQKYMSENRMENPENPNRPLFYNSRGEKLTRSGVAYILRKYMQGLNIASKTGATRKITPHCLRHSKAMHLLEAGVNLIYIRDFLGHEYVETTEIYARANPEAKRRAIQAADAEIHTETLPDWNDDNALMNSLRSL